MGAWQEQLVVMYQNYVHPLDASVVGVDGTVSSPQYGIPWELANVTNLIPSSMGRFASAQDPRGGTTKILRIQLTRSLLVDCLALINMRSFVTTPGGSGNIDTELAIHVELFHGLGTGPNYGQNGSGSAGTAIGTTFQMPPGDVTRYGCNLFFTFTPVNAQYFTIRFSHPGGAQVQALGIGNVMLGRSFSIAVPPAGYPLLAPTRKRIEHQTMVAGRSFGAVQIETRYKSRRRWSIPTLWRSEADRELFEAYFADRDTPRMDGFQNQHLKKRLDLPTAIVPPWQWYTNSSPYAFPVFGKLEGIMDAEYDEIGNSVTRVEFSEIA